ncbi:hypothetical protein ACNPN0_09305 [Glutamicibacter sp. AGC84]
MDGFGAIGKEPISNSSDMQKFVEVWPRNNFIRKWSQLARGAVALYCREPVSGSVVILPDPLGSAIVYRYSRAGIRAASTDLSELVFTLQTIGINLKKSLAFAVELVISTNGGLNESSYEDIDSIPILSYVRIDSESIKVESYDSNILSSKNELDYDLVIQSAATEIMDTVSAASKMPNETKICHLTGGFDSRLVAAATMANGTSGSFRYFCQGDPVLPDKVLAEKVAAELDLTMTDYSGIAWNYTPSDFGGGLIGPMLHSAGLLPVGPHMGAGNSDSVILSGGYGGTFRSTYDYRFLDRLTSKISGAELGSSLWGDYLFSGKESSIISREYSSNLASLIESRMAQGIEMGVNEDALGDLFYIQTRARYFISHITKSWSKFTRRIDPLYSPIAIQAALSMPLQRRAGNSIGYDLALHLDPAILELPFDSQKFNLKSCGREELIKTRDFTVFKPKYDGRKSSIAPSKDFGYLKLPKATKEDIAVAKSMRARAYQISGRNAARSELRELVSSIPKSELSEFINMAELDVLLKRPANTRVRVRTLFNLYSSLRWYVS